MGKSFNLDNVDLPGLIVNHVSKQVEEQEGLDLLHKDNAYYIDEAIHDHVGKVRFYAHPLDTNSIFAAYMATDDCIVLVELDPVLCAHGIQLPINPYLIEDIKDYIQEGIGIPHIVVDVPSKYKSEALWFLPKAA